MKVGDSVHNVIGEAYEDGEAKKKNDETTVAEVASQADWKGQFNSYVY